MPLPSSGSISLGQVNTELGLSSTASISLGSTPVRTLAGVASGAISFGNLHGKSNAPVVFAAAISSNQTNLNLRSWALANGWNGTSAAEITVNPGVYVYATSTANAGLTIDGSWPGSITLINNGFIAGMGGQSPTPSGSNQQLAGNPGGSAISLGVSCTITNNSYIGGGGGSGGTGGGTNSGGGGTGGGGGGAGGGAGGTTVVGNMVTPGTISLTGTAGGAPGAASANGTATQYSHANATGGGRIFPGVGGVGGQLQGGTIASTGGGAGGAGGGVVIWRRFPSGDQLPAANAGGGGGGGWGASGGAGTSLVGVARLASGGAGGAVGGTGAGGGGAGGAGGRAIQLNGFTATRNGGGTTYGAVS